MHSPCFSEKPMIIGRFENDEQRYKDVVVMKFSKDIQRRLLSFGGGREVRPKW